MIERREPARPNRAASRSPGLLNKSPSAVPGVGYFSHEMLVPESSDVPPNNVRFGHSSWLSIELGDKTLLLRIPHTLVAGCGETKLKLDWKFPPRLLVSMVPDGVIQDAREQRHLVVLSRREPTNYRNGLPGKMYR